jgi:4-hydroxybenzoate polyprenyltransferase
VKNLFLFIPIFFAGHLFELDRLLILIIGFLSFSFAASFIYIINDLFDLKSDLLHPEKKFRPIPSGEINTVAAKSVAGLSLAVSILLAFQCNLQFVMVLIGYIILNFLYSVKLKKIPVLDISIISIGFLLRIVAGGILVDVPVSKWLILLTFFLSMILALAKRRNDILIL